MSENAIQWFTLDCFCRQSDDPLAREVFNAMLSLRITAYRARFTRGYLPFSATDFIARHHVFCIEHGGKLRALAATMQVSLATCDQFGLRFPLLERCQASGGEAHRRAIEMLTARDPAGGALLYWGRYCRLPNVPRDATLCAALRELFVAAVVADHITAPVARSTGLGYECVLPVYERIGFRRIEGDGVPLPPLPPGAFPLPTFCLEMDLPTAWALACLERQGNQIARRTLLVPQEMRTSP